MKKIILATLLSVLMITSLFAQVYSENGPSSTADSNVMNVTLTGESSSINYTPTVGVIGLDNQTALIATLTPDNSYDVSVTWGDVTPTYTYSGAGSVWIDWNRNGNFEVTELIGDWTGTPEVIESYNFTVPTEFTGSTRMRVMQQEGGSLPLDPASSYTWGSNMDFTITKYVVGSPSIPTLTTPANGATNVAIDTNLEWTTGDNTDHAVLHIADNVEFTGATIVNPATTGYSLTMDYNSTYYWKVVAVSETAIEAESVVWSFTTEYGVATIPYSENFDTYESGDVPAGWIPLDTTGNSYADNQIANSNYASAPNSYYLENSSSTTGVLIASTPKVPTMGNRVRLSAKTADAGATLVVGTMTNASDETTFVAIDTLALTITHTMYLIDLPDTAGEQHVSFKHGLSGTYKDLYLDNVNIEEIPTTAVLEFSPDSVDFGSFLHENTTATPVTVTISNIGGVATTITEITVVNTNYFTVTNENAANYVLEPQASMTVDVTPLTTLVGEHNSFLRVKEDVDTSDFFPAINHDLDLTVNILSSTGNDHNDPFILTSAPQIVVNNTTTPYDVTYAFCSSQSVVYKLNLATSKLLDISFEGTAYDTKMWVFNSFDQIDTATQTSDAWYYNDDETSAGTGGRFIEAPKGRDRALWSKMNPSFALPGDYYIVMAGYGSANGEFTMTVNVADLPAPAAASNPFPADEAESQPSNLTLTWDNADYTETIDIWFGNAGSMVLVENNIAAVEEYAVTLETAREYEWKIVNRNYSGETVDTLVATWSFTTTGEAPVAATYTSPVDAAIDVALTGNIVWASVTGADGYYVYFSEDMNFTDVVEPIDQTATTFAYTGDYSTTYYWKVIPYNVMGSPTEGIETWSFTTAPSPFPEADIVFDGTRSTSQHMPIEPYYGYTMTQIIYHQDELNIENSAITSISYLYNKYSAWTETVEIYAKHTTKDTFADGYDWELNDFTHVYSGTMSVNTTDAIVTFDFDTPFIYNNTDNLVILFFATQTGYNSDSAEFYNYPVEGNRSLNVYSDGTNYFTTYPASIPLGTLKAYRPVSAFNYQVLTTEADFTVSADTLTFENQVMDTTSDPQILTVSNLGIADLDINSIVLTGTNADQFQLTDANVYPVTLVTGNNMAVQVVYAPNTAGDHTAELQITDDQMRVVNTIQLVGNSIDTNIYAEDLPWSESFEGDLYGWTTLIESSSASANITLNTTASNVQDGAAAIRFYNDSDVEASLQLISPNLVPDMDAYRLRFWMKGTVDSELILAKWDTDLTVLTVIDTLDVPVTYEQTTVEFVGTTTGNERFVFLPVFATTYDYVYLDNLTFEMTPLLPVAELNVDMVEFGDVEVATTSLAEEISITNVGPGTLTIESVEITGTDAGLFAWDYVAETPDMALENGETLELTVTFTPDAVGEKTATLVINDNLVRNIRISSNSKSINNTRNANTVALTGMGWVPPQGSTCSNPLPLELPAVDVTGNTIDFIDDYSSTWITPTSSYLNGDDVVYQFTLAQGVLLNGTITTTGSWIGAFILEDEPNLETPAAVTLTKTNSSNILSYTNEFIPAGTYFLIISSYPSPQSVDYTINLTTDALPAPAAATSPSPAHEAIDQPTAVTLGWTNANYTETVDLWFGVEGAREMALVLDDVDAVEEYVATDLLTNTTYNWKVVNRNYTGETVDTLVTTWSFTTVGNAPDPVTYTSPADASIDRPLSGNMTWNAAAGAEGYKVFFSTDMTFTDVTAVEQAATTYAYSGLEYSTTYYWKVIPYNIVGDSEGEILTWSFTTIPDPTLILPVTIDFEGSTTVPAAYITSTNMYVSASGHGNTSNVLYKNIYTLTTSAYIQFQDMTNISPSSVVEFDYRFVDFSSPYPGINFIADHDYLIAKISVDDGVTFTTIDQINSLNHVVSGDYVRYTINIGDFAGQTAILRLEMPDDDVEDYYFDIDNIYFGEPLITSLDTPVVTMGTAIGLAVSWLPVENAVIYQVWACDTPDGTYEIIDTTTDLFYVHEIDDNMKFFKVKASTVTPSKGFRRN